MILYSAVVSRHHVELRRVGLEWEIINLGTNGTYLNGKRITQSMIADGAIIRLARSGPNIQVRMGEAALKELSETIPASRITHQRQELPLVPTEITGHTPQTDETAQPEADNEQAILSPSEPI